MTENDDKQEVAQIEALAEFRFTLRKFLHFSEEAAIGAGLTPQQHQLLLQILGAPVGTAASIGYLAERLVLRHHSVVELGNRCEAAGLVVRTGDPENRRHVVLQLTGQGAELLHKLSEAHRLELNEMAPRLIEVLHGVTDRLVRKSETGRENE